MYEYTGKDQFSEAVFSKKFKDELEAINFAHDNALKFPNYQVLDTETNEVICSPEIDQDDIDTSLDNMFPDGDEWLDE